MSRRLALRAYLLLLAAGVPAELLIHASAQAAGAGPVLVVVAHPDDEALGMAGVIANARAAGRRVVVAVATNGDRGGAGETSTPLCRAPTNPGRGSAQLGLLRDAETIAAMGELGLNWSTDLATTDIVFLGYPDSKLASVAASSAASRPIRRDCTAPSPGPATARHRIPATATSATSRAAPIHL